MLSIEKCRQVLGDRAIDMTDEQIMKVRDSLYALVEMTLDQYFEDFKGDISQIHTKT